MSGLWLWIDPFPKMSQNWDVFLDNHIFCKISGLSLEEEVSFGVS
jgi:hypothetical protein